LEKTAIQVSSRWNRNSQPGSFATESSGMWTLGVSSVTED
jgi:hypothetical protein